VIVTRAALGAFLACPKRLPQYAILAEG